jgi:probable addiction module antidote protein
MALKLKPFDAAKYLDTLEAQAELLNDAFRSGDSGYIAAALGTVARAHGMTELAQKTGLNRAALYEALSAEGNPTIDTIMRVSCALGIELGARPATEGSPCHDPQEEPRPRMRS